VKDRIIIRNARQHNLKGIDLELPRRALIVLTGPSGSGKSSLAFDTIYAEGQRRYVESLSTYAKQFLERMEKPAVDAVEGISPAVAIEQKNPTRTSRSTVGTATEVYDYMRLLWARAGTTHCPVCDRPVEPDTVQSATDDVLTLDEGTRFLVTFPLVRSDQVSHREIVENLRALGFVRVVADGEMRDLDGEDAVEPDAFGVDLAAAPSVLVVVDRLAAGAGIRERLADSIGTALAEGDGEAVVLVAGLDGPAAARAAAADGAVAASGDGALPGFGALRFSERFRCPDHPDAAFLDPSPRLFSFNNPYGSCPTCTGFGATLEYDSDLIVPDTGLSLAAGVVDPWEKPRYHRERAALLEFARDEGVSTSRPWRELPEPFRDAVLRGRSGRGGKSRFKGMIPFLRSREKKRYKQYIRVFLRRYQRPGTCPDCGGARLRPEALNVRVGDHTIAAASALTTRALAAWLNDLELSPRAAAIAAPVLRELESRLRFLGDVGLGYLTLDRQTRTLSGGEAQRISLANSLGAKLVDALYVLDEPTIGLHPRDTAALLDLLGALRDRGNTVLVVEHDPAAIDVADEVVELGPGSGENGGRVVFQGGRKALEHADTVTGRYVGGRAPIDVPATRRKVDGPRLSLRGARLHNLRGVDVDIPLGALTVVTGVSGSGKSTLVHDILYRALEKELADGPTAKRHLGERVGAYEALEGVEKLDRVVLVDQSPIGRTPRSNPVTYIKAFDHLRRLYAAQPLARERGYGPGHFSFNVAGGRCEACKGDGVVQVEMVFMADVLVRCEVCGGARFKSPILDVRFKGHSIADALDLTIDEAIHVFIRQDRFGRALWQLQQVGLGYLRLGQPAPTLSGGEAQRLKIARELVAAAKKGGRRFYLLDEPTTGLSGEDIRKLLAVLARLLDAGHTVLVVEHNLEVIKSADWVIDLGPEAGSEGGRVVAMGRPEEIAAEEASHTGRYLAPLLESALSAV
jgi:excinuclease ABC subunit A